MKKCFDKFIKKNRDFSIFIMVLLLGLGLYIGSNALVKNGNYPDLITYTGAVFGGFMTLFGVSLTLDYYHKNNKELKKIEEENSIKNIIVKEELKNLIELKNLCIQINTKYSQYINFWKKQITNSFPYKYGPADDDIKLKIKARCDLHNINIVELIDESNEIANDFFELKHKLYNYKYYNLFFTNNVLKNINNNFKKPNKLIVISGSLESIIESFIKYYEVKPYFEYYSEVLLEDVIEEVNSLVLNNNKILELYSQKTN